MFRSTIRDKIIPHAVSWFTGEAAQGEEFGDLDDEDDDEDDDAEDDDEDEDEDEDEDDDEDEEETKTKKKVWTCLIWSSELLVCFLFFNLKLECELTRLFFHLPHVNFLWNVAAVIC